MRKAVLSGSPSARRILSRDATHLGSRRLKRKEQQRAINTRVLILKAALSEFAQEGFEAASIRNIAERSGLQHPLITYYFRTKVCLWRAVAQYVFAEIRALWDQRAPAESDLAPIERVRAQYQTFLRFTLEYPDFHHFVLRENKPGNPRLAWLGKRYLKPTLDRFLPELRAAQKAGQLPMTDPVLLHYMLLGTISVLSSLADEMRLVADIRAHDPGIVNEYWQLIETTVFKRPATS